MPKPKTPVVSQDVFEGLYESATKFRKLEPWVFMEDSELFGVQNPDTREIAYCCVMGAMDQVLGLVAYRGTSGLEYWRKMQSGEISPETCPDVMFMQDCLIATFVGKGELDTQDKKSVAKLGLKFTGSRRYPQFRSHRPGLMPWYLDESDAKFMAAMDFVPRLIVHGATSLPENEDEDDNKVLVYLAKRLEADRVDVELKWITPEPVKEKPVAPLKLDDLRIHRLKQMKLGKGGAWEADWFYVPSSIHDREIPYFARIALIADKKSGYICNLDTMQLEQTPPAGVVAALFGAIEKTKLLPSEIRVRNTELEKALKLVASELGFAVVRKDSLKAIDQARESLFESALPDLETDEMELR